MVPKFRGKRKDNGERVVGVPIPNSFCNVVHMIPILLTDKVAYPPERLHEYLIEIVPETLGQSTGLKDKNGVEIFEGDVVQWGDTPDREEEPIRVAVVKINPDIQFDSNVGIFQYGQFAYQDTERFLTILGNIYENPELLEVEG